MEEIRNYKDLAVWKQARMLAKDVYIATRRFPKEELFGVTSQVRRACVSVASNIAEGCGRGTWRSGTNFFFIARGSLYEVETQLIVAYDLGYLSEQDLKDLLVQITKCKQLLNGLIRYFESKTSATSNSPAPSSAANNE
jgi:four helix bundle protein